MVADAHIDKYLTIKGFFFIGMSLILISLDFISLFLGWEIIGLGSASLIAYWNTRISASRSSLKGLSINKVGDYSVLLF